MSSAGTTVTPLAGAASTDGALPATTITDSSRAGDTSRVSAPAGRVSTRMGLTYPPPGSTTSTSNGGWGSGVKRKRPSASVRTLPARPRTATSASATGCPPSFFTTRPSNAIAGAEARRSDAATTNDRFMWRFRGPAGSPESIRVLLRAVQPVRLFHAHGLQRGERVHAAVLGVVH